FLISLVSGTALPGGIMLFNSRYSSLVSSPVLGVSCPHSGVQGTVGLSLSSLLGEPCISSKITSRDKTAHFFTVSYRRYTREPASSSYPTRIHFTDFGSSFCLLSLGM